MFRPVRLLKLPLVELPQARVFHDRSFAYVESNVASDRLYASSGPAAVVDTGLTGLSPSCATNIKLVYGQRRDAPRPNAEHIRAIDGPAKAV